jgi:hypothetical protein
LPGRCPERRLSQEPLGRATSSKSTRAHLLGIRIRQMLVMGDFRRSSGPWRKVLGRLDFALQANLSLRLRSGKHAQEACSLNLRRRTPIFMFCEVSVAFA